jgi:hypothetical protein
MPDSRIPHAPTYPQPLDGQLAHFFAFNNRLPVNFKLLFVVFLLNLMIAQPAPTTFKQRETKSITLLW